MPRCCIKRADDHEADGAATATAQQARADDQFDGIAEGNGEVAASAMRIVFLANVDWFFQSHFIFLARRAKLNGWDVALAAHVDAAREALEADGLELIALPTRRGVFAPADYGSASAIVARELRRRPDTLLHGFGLFGIVVGSLAGRRAGLRRSVFTITGRGYSAAARSTPAHLIRGCSRVLCASVADGPSVRWLAENEEDLKACGLSAAVRQSRAAVLGGAGIDPDDFTLSPMPPRGPVRLALVARMIWSKGVDLAVEAVQAVRAQGVNLTLTLAGPIDGDNPKALRGDQMRAFEAGGGVRWVGQVHDINALWASHHAAVLPSRGGEGLPKSLIEAAACGRPIITTRVPGCRAFAGATGGWCVEPDSPSALADALLDVCSRKNLDEMGRKARQTVLSSYTHDYNWNIVEKFYDELGCSAG